MQLLSVWNQLFFLDSWCFCTYWWKVAKLGEDNKPFPEFLLCCKYLEYTDLKCKRPKVTSLGQRLFWLLTFFFPIFSRLSTFKTQGFGLFTILSPCCVRRGILRNSWVQACQVFACFATNLFLGSNAEGKHRGGKAWAQFSHCVSHSRYLFVQVAFHPRHSPSPSQRSPGGLSRRCLLLVPALQKLWFVGSHSHPLAEAWAGRESMTSQEPHESNSSCLPCIL